jgi:hypothetical protein
MLGDAEHYSRIFVLPLVNGKAQGNGVAVAPNLRGHAPDAAVRRGGGTGWSADGRTLFFTLREAGREEPTSTNLDIYAVATAAAG